ncbi:TIGR00341 family protein [Glycomyces sp. L485]|uniref:TIGR00341 family protein n=1 Tax=Glycomyces sp. L485 TaxID=2909235 RepID=UPI001F4AB5F4|nr:TIGR00341 family protein [Glycomyces sp. L485]MCH7230812.1 TIGR00341 family protein [Glycomyces sp. L485]
MSVLIPATQRRSLDTLRDSLELDYGESGAKRSAYWSMLTLSGFIAVAGVLADSTAAVIGAMIIAPLSTPILAVGLGIVVGDAAMVGRSLLYVAASVVAVVAIGFGISSMLPDPTDALANSQIEGRTSPTIMDLIAAIATGFAGAIAATRRDVGTVLPGVAIAISLVPPLGVMGVCFGDGNPFLALGAFVLFLSNVVVLVVASILVFKIGGYFQEAEVAAEPSWRRRAYPVLAAVFVAVAIPIGLNSMTALWSSQIEAAAENWSDAYVDEVSWQAHKVVIEVRSPDDLPPVEELQEAVDKLVFLHPEVVLVHTVGERVTVETAGR